MAGFTTYPEFCPTGLKTHGIGLRLFHKIGGVALNAHVVGIVRVAAPVHHVAWCDGFLIIQMKPTLTASVSRAGIPSKRQTLYHPMGLFNQVLLQWEYPKSVTQCQFGRLRGTRVGDDFVLTIRLQELRFLTVVNQGVGKMSQYRVG